MGLKPKSPDSKLDALSSSLTSLTHIMLHLPSVWCRTLSYYFFLAFFWSPITQLSKLNLWSIGTHLPHTCWWILKIHYFSDEFSFLKKVIYLFWERQRQCKEGQREGESRAGSVLPEHSLTWGWNPWGHRNITWAETKSQTLNQLSHRAPLWWDL